LKKLYIQNERLEKTIGDCVFYQSRLSLSRRRKSDYHYREEEKVQGETIPKEKQQLRIYLDKRNRKGKAVTLVTGFRGTEEELQALGRLLKTRCGVGGSVKNGEIIVQGDHREKVLNLLREEGYAKAAIV